MVEKKRRILTPEEQVQRAWDIQQIKNVMGRHAYYHEYNRHDIEMEELWVNEPEHQKDAVFVQNHGFQMGYELIDDNYNRKSFNIWREGLQEFIDDDPSIEDSFENLAMGSSIIHLLTAPLIEVADDGMTAQGVWDGNGQITMGYPGNKMSTKVMFEKYKVDFAKENGEWKIWKMFIATDICLEPAGTDCRDLPINITGEMEFKLRQLEEEDPETEIILTYPMMVYNSTFNAPDWPVYPEPYYTYADTIPTDPSSHPRFNPADYEKED